MGTGSEDKERNAKVRQKTLCFDGLLYMVDGEFFFQNSVSE